MGPALVRVAAIVALAASYALVGCAGRPWARSDVGLEAAFGVELVGDAVQTSAIVAGCHEYNPIVGPCGERVPFPVYFLTAAALHLAISAVLPARARAVFQGATLGLEGHVIYMNSITPVAPGWRSR